MIQFMRVRSPLEQKFKLSLVTMASGMSNNSLVIHDVFNVYFASSSPVFFFFLCLIG